jgi:hypothetical protein
VYLKRQIIVIAVLTMTFLNSRAQVNYVLNYSFEQDTLCGGIGTCSATWVNNWFNPTISYIDWNSYPCFGASGTTGVPQSLGGYQYARTGQCDAVILADTINDVGYITGTLSDSLKATKKYCVTFYVSLADSEWWAISEIGAYLSNDSLCNESTVRPLTYVPQIENPATNFLTNKVDWIPISGEFQAMGGEKFITIGDFHYTVLSDYDSVGHGGTVSGYQSEVQTGYFVDDVYVRELTIAVAGKNDTICNDGGDSTLMGQNAITTGVSFSWLPITGLANPNAPQTKASPTVTTTYTLTVVNDSIHGCNCADSVTKDSITVTVNTCAGISELRNKNNGISIYPNPSGGNFTLSISNISGKPEIEVYNVLGEKIYQSKLNFNNTQINLGRQSGGVYLYRVLDEDGNIIANGKIAIY